jgi:hypothetical protein
LPLRAIFVVFSSALLAISAASARAEAPRIAAGAAHPALLVDGAPFLVLGAQANNSSNYPAVLDQVWPAVERVEWVCGGPLQFSRGQQGLEVSLPGGIAERTVPVLRIDGRLSGQGERG